jgi:hypothetical protein
MSQVVKRTGEPVVFSWTFDPAQEPFITEFRLEELDGTVVQGGIAVSARSITKTAGSTNKVFRLAAVKGTLAAYASETVEVVIDNTPPAPGAFSAV